MARFSTPQFLVFSELKNVGAGCPRAVPSVPPYATLPPRKAFQFARQDNGSYIPVCTCDPEAGKAGITSMDQSYSIIVIQQQGLSKHHLHNRYLTISYFWHVPFKLYDLSIFEPSKPDKMIKQRHEHGRVEKNTLIRVIPTMAFNSSHLTFYLAYLSGFHLACLLTFYLAYLLTFYLAFYLEYLLPIYLAFYLEYLLTLYLAYLSGIPSGMSSDILSGISSDILSSISIWHSIWHVFWHFYLILSGISIWVPSGMSSDILSGISSDILSGILSGISSDIVSSISIWHSIWHVFWHSIWFYLACLLTFYLHIFWHPIWHSIWNIFWHSI